ncbi:MAG: beta-glucosidase [Candidatus Eisenbacteria bacterium]|nr:beta-glucosidase [Candidatus Eisenbacteria bacterium]
MSESSWAEKNDPPPRSSRFPEGFLWGAATSAYQIEGSPLADGAGPSNWHRFTHAPGGTEDGSTGDVASDHYRRAGGDADLMKEMGLGAYRFSIAWSRIFPDGGNSINRAGLDFYSRLVDLLLDRGIRPCATLYHWDHPAALDERGGWLDPSMEERFAAYASVAFRALGDRVSMWMTINEPWVIAHAGFMAGVHPPGHRSAAETAKVSRALLRAHGLALRAGRAEGAAPIGLVANLEPKEPASDAEEDRAAAERGDIYMNRQYLDPVLLGRPPAGLPDIYGPAWVDYTPEDLALIGEPIDFLGVNYYTRAVVRRDGGALPDRESSVRLEDSLYTETGWEVHPEGLTRVLLRLKELYGSIPLYVTENGAAFPDPPRAEGETVEDPLRVAYLRSHLKAAREAIRRGAGLRGYFVWSLMDNLEWSRGFTKRFGVFHVDYATQKRTWKRSGRFYRKVIETNGGVLDGEERG